MMAKTKIYFWLKVDKKFFDNLFIKRLKNMPGGYTMTVIYIRLMLESLEDDCILYYEGYFDSLVQELALKLDVSEDDINMTLAYFTKCGLIQIDDDGHATLSQAKAMVESETNWAKYKRDQRKNSQNLPKLENVQKLETVSNSCPTEIEIDKEIEKEIEIDNNNYNKTVIGSNLSEILKNIGIHITDRQLEQLLDYVSLDGMSIDMLDYAIEITSKADRPSFKYLKAILENWKKEGLTLLEQVKVEEHEDTEFPF